MNGEILRGEVYWVCLDDSVGAEEKTGRPAVVVSANGLNAKLEVVTIAFLTTSGFGSATRPSVVGPNGMRRRVCCEQIRSVDKSRLQRYDSTLDESELIRVTGALASALSIPLPHGGTKQVSTVEKTESDDVAALRCEADMWRRMYEKVMDQFVELRVGTAMTEKAKAVEKHEIKTALPEPDLGYEDELAPKKAENKKSQKEKAEWNGVKVNINTVETAAELKERTGMSRLAANEIVRVRKVVGAYEKLEDLLALENFGNISMKRYGHMLTVGENEPADEAPPKKTPVNVNTANAYQLMEAGFTKEIAHRIVHHRRHCPPFKDVDELLEIDGLSRGDLRKLRDKLEV